MTAGDLAPPMRRALELAWDSFGAGSLGVGAVVTRGDEVVATGRNRMAETDPGDDVLAGTSLAHAEMNALAKLRWGSRPVEGLELWTTLQPCLQCLGAIRLSAVRSVHVLAPDPLFRGVEGMRHLNAFIGRSWPDIVEQPPDEWSALALLLPTHFNRSWRQTELSGWFEALPAVDGLAGDLLATGELRNLVAAGASLPAVAAALWDRLGACLPEVARLAATGCG